MKITKKLLKEIIEEEVKDLLNEDPQAQPVRTIIEKLAHLATTLSDLESYVARMLEYKGDPAFVLDDLSEQPDLLLKNPELKEAISRTIRSIERKAEILKKIAPRGKF